MNINDFMIMISFWDNFSKLKSLLVVIQQFNANIRSYYFMISIDYIINLNEIIG